MKMRVGLQRKKNAQIVGCEIHEDKYSYTVTANTPSGIRNIHVLTLERPKKKELSDKQSVVNSTFASEL